MKIGITTFSLHHPDFQQQLSSLLRNKVVPDFIILHYGGTLNSFSRFFNYAVRTFKQYRLGSIKQILKRVKSEGKTSNSKFYLSDSEKKEVNIFLAKANIIKVKGINDLSTIKNINSLGSSVILCNSGILREYVLKNTNVTFLNIHASKLPEYRGMNNVEWALFENKDIYVTIHKISRGIDEGDILYQEKIEINSNELKNIEDYRKYIYYKSYQAAGKAVRKLIDGEIIFVKQEKKYEPLLLYYTMHPLLRQRLQQKL